MHSLLESATTQVEFDYTNEPFRGLDIIKKQNLNNQSRLSNLKKNFTPNEFIYPLNYIFEFIQYSYDVIDLTDKSYQLTNKLKELNKSKNKIYIELKLLENETVNLDVKKKGFKKVVKEIIELLEKVINTT